MISDASQRNIEIAFHRAIKDHFVLDANDKFEIEEDRNGLEHRIAGEKLFVITISSFAFRLLTIFKIIDDPHSRDYYLRSNSAQSLDEALAEAANMCSGALNRELSAHFPHLAMSTPSPLTHRCIAFLNELRPARLASYRVTIQESVRFYATLCLCCSAPIEVAAPTSEQDAAVEGALEMF
jgi:hypothetical protein